MRAVKFRIRRAYGVSEWEYAFCDNEGMTDEELLEDFKESQRQEAFHWDDYHYRGCVAEIDENPPIEEVLKVITDNISRAGHSIYIIQKLVEEFLWKHHTGA
jgi:hypothetical protein